MDGISALGLRRKRQPAKTRGADQNAPAQRLWLEPLEDRVVPTTLEVIGTATNFVADNVTTFATFAAAYAASTSPNDIIQIEPLAGNVGAITLNDAAKALTVQGDPAFAASSNAEITGSINVNVNNVHLNHLYINGTITTAAAITGTRVDNSTLAPTSGNAFQETAGNGNGSATLTGNVIFGNVVLQGGTTMATASSGDQILYNQFLGANAQLTIGTTDATTNDVLVQGNNFVDASSPAITVTDSQNVSFLRNTIVMNGNGTAILVNGPTFGATGDLFQGNTIRTAGGTGVDFATTADELLNVTFESNEFQGNATAIAVTGNNDLAAGSLLNAGTTWIGTPLLPGGNNDLTTGSNDFHGVATPINIADNAITDSHLTVNAGNNIVDNGVVNIVTNASGSGATPLDVIVYQGDNLSPLQGLVASLYNNFLTHTPTLAELNFYVNEYATIGQAGIVNQIMHSPEAYTRIIDELYRNILGRTADASGQAFYLTMFQNGATEEQVMANMLLSPEFATRADALSGIEEQLLSGIQGTSANQNFLYGLYDVLLGRTPSASEVNYYLQMSGGNFNPDIVVQDLLASTEFRTDATEAFYGNVGASTATPSPFLGLFPDLLQQSTLPSSQELDFYANSTNNLMQIAAEIASGQEYSLNG